MTPPKPPDRPDLLKAAVLFAATGVLLAAIVANVLTPR